MSVARPPTARAQTTAHRLPPTPATGARASVIVRSKDEERLIERTLVSLRRQTVDPEIIIVDSGSTDRTVEIARRWCDRLIEIPAERFSYGGSLNLGAAAASAPIQFALSAHCAPERDDWIERSLSHYGRTDVAAAIGDRWMSDGRRLPGVFHQDLAHARANPFWGFSNHASSWRAEVWRRFPFDERLEASEDRAWAFAVLEAGWVIAFDPVLWVDMSHRAAHGIRNYFRRSRKEARGVAAFADLPPYGARDALVEWLTQNPLEGHSRLRHRLSYKRVVALAGKYAGLRSSVTGLR